MSEGINVREIKAEAMQMVAAGLRGQHSNNKVIRLCQEIERLTLERDQAPHITCAARPDGLPGAEQWRCNICGGLVRFDGTAPKPGIWGKGGAK